MERSNVMVTREGFLAAHVVAFPKYEEVDVPGLGVVWVKKLNAGEQDRFEVANAEAKAADFRARMVSAVCIDPRGAMLFSGEDIPALTLFDAEVLDPIVEAALRINKFSKKDQEALRKNSTGQGGSS